MGPRTTPRCCSRTPIIRAIRESRPFSGSWEPGRWRPDVTAADAGLTRWAITTLVVATESSPALYAGPHYSQGRGELVAFGRPATVAADDGAGESQRRWSHHRVFLCPEGGRRHQLADQH